MRKVARSTMPSQREPSWAELKVIRVQSMATITGPQQDHHVLASFTFNKDFLGDLSHFCKFPMTFASSSERGGQGHYFPSQQGNRLSNEWKGYGTELRTGYHETYFNWLRKTWGTVSNFSFMSLSFVPSTSFCMCENLCICICATCVPASYRGLESLVRSLELALQVALSHLL